MKRKERKRRIKWSTPKILTAVECLFSVIFLVLLKMLDVLPLKYFIPVLLVLIIIDGVFIFFNFFKKLKTKKSKIIISGFNILMIIIYLVGGLYLYRTLKFMGNFGGADYKTENYSVIVLKDSSYNKLEDVNGKELGMVGYESEGKTKAEDHLKSKISVTFKDFETPQALSEALFDKKSEVIVLEDSYKELLKETDEDFENKIKVIYTFSVKIETEDISKDTDVTNNPFSIYISGIDTYGSISSVSRSDVNIVATVNPTTHQVLLISIPRDYYVQLHGTTGYKDKLTHAGIYGVDMSVKTIEDLLGIDINYYVKVNFSSLIKIVDVLSGVDVYSEYTFTSYSGYRFTKGYNHMNGTQALDFARTRKAFASGDRQRGKNQEAVIEALIRKCSSSAIITKYNSLLNSVEGSFKTNLSNKEITSLAKMQLNDMPEWTVTSLSLDGGDGSNYTYSYKSSKAYVMIPYESSIKEAQDALTKILGSEVLESSYNKNATNVQNTNTSSKSSTSSSTSTTIILNNSDVTLNVGDTTTLSASVSPSSAVTWSSSDSSVATVSSTGKVTAVDGGTIKVTATANGVSKSCIVRVNNPINTILPSNNTGGMTTNN